MAADGWGSSYSFGPSTSRIVYAKTTLVPGRLPPITSTTGPLFLWPGMSNSKGDLIQTTMDAWQDNKGYCKAAAGQWCVEASVFGSFGQRNGPTVPVSPTDQVTIEYKLETDGNTWTQTVTLACKVVSTLQSASGPMPGTGFGFATEADADSYTIDTQYYLNTEFHFAAADPNFAKTGVGGVGAKFGATGTGSGIGTAKNVHTPDGGLTWLVDLITLPAMQPQGPQSGVPTAASGCTGGSGGSGGTAGAGGSGGTGAGGSSGAGAGGTGTSGSGGNGASGTGSSGSAGASVGGAAGSAGSVSGTAGTFAGGSGGLASAGAAGAISAGSGGTGGSSGPAGSGGAVASGSGGQSVAGAPGAGGSTLPASGADGAPPANSSNGPGCSCSVPARSGSSGALSLLALCGLAFAVNRRARRAR